MSTAAPANQHAGKSLRTLELIGSLLVTVVGAGLTTYGAFAHAHAAFAPGSALVFIGAAWLGNVLARHGVRLSPAPAPRSSGEHEQS